ncbi:MAG: hypothetical protein FWD58_10425 [Firmicutes bacterium]|nr:hypothetical protein [Bacillota bacterium]
MTDKQLLRTTLSALRTTIVDRAHKDKLIQDKLISFLHSEFPTLKTVFTYVSMGSEVDTRAFIASADGYTLYFPYTCDGVMRPVLAQRRTGLEVDRQGNVVDSGQWTVDRGEDKLKTTHEPRATRNKPPSPIPHPPITIVPLLGFNENLHRIGYGKGHYDRYFTVGGDPLGAPPDTVKIGLAYDEQACSFTPKAYDVPMDYIITPGRIVKSEK